MLQVSSSTISMTVTADLKTISFTRVCAHACTSLYSY